MQTGNIQRWHYKFLKSVLFLMKVSESNICKSKLTTTYRKYFRKKKYVTQFSEKKKKSRSDTLSKNITLK